MTILNRYIARISKQLNIAMEAWWDDWYDKTFDSEYMDHGEVDVWDEPELPKELGIKSPVWTELLTRGDDDMFQYRNLGGNSGVSEYDSGVDWFLIKFKDGSMYLYTHASTRPEHIYRMRQLAEAGTGLNAYVNHMFHQHGIQYAGRNYKGRLTLQPGIESIHVHKGIRAIQLIIAHQNTLKVSNMDKTISQESIGEMITGIKNFLTGRDKHGVKGSDAKPGAKLSDKRIYGKEGQAKFKAIEDAVKKYYLNDNWIDKQEIVTGKVSGAGIAGTLNFNGSLGNDPLGNVEKGITFAKQWIKSWEAIVSATNDAVCAADKVAYDAFKAGKGTEKIVEDTLAKFDAIPDPIKRFPKPNGCGLGNRAPVVEAVNARGIKDWVVVKVVKPQQEGELEALTHDQIKVAANLLLRLLDGVVERPWFSWLDHSDGSALNDWFDDHDSLFDEYYSRFDHHTANDVWVEAIDTFIDEYQVIAALERWIDRSLSGKTKVSKENFQMNIALEKFEEQKVKAGQDGLEPVAKKAMAITESLLGKSQAASEATCVSNEGIWGAIRYLFGGNYEDLPKINAAYDEAIDIVKATYGNPEWVKNRKLNKNQVVSVNKFVGAAHNPEKALAAVKKNNAKAFEETNTYVKEEVEYLTKFAKALNSGDKEKIQALLDMFKIKPKRQLPNAPEMDMGIHGRVLALDAEGLIKTAGIFEEAVKYRRATDAVYTSGLWKLLYTEAGKERYGSNGTETAKLEGPAKELAIAIGKAGDNVQESFYSSFSIAWENIDDVVQGTLLLMEASAS